MSTPTPQATPDYASHEAVYQHLAASGAKGWSSDEEYQEMWRLVAPWIPERAGLRALELGCGAGNFSALLAQQGHRVHGVEISPTAVAWANRRAKETGLDCTFAVDDVRELASCASESFDLVIDGHCLHCIIGEDRARCLQAVERALAPEGRFVILTMCGEVRNERLLQDWDSRTRVAFHEGKPVRHIGLAEEIVEEVRKSGFEIEHWHVDARRSEEEQDDLVLVARRKV